MSNRKIRISKADKGGAVVIQDTENYIKEADRQLGNTVHYERVQNDNTVKITKTSNDIVDELLAEGSIDQTTHRWAITDEKTVRCHVFYTLPKIHKSSTANVPGRPIVIWVNGTTEKISKLVDHWLINNIKSASSYIQDTTSMLQNIEKWNEQYGPFPENTKLLKIDVVELYTNIPHPDMLDAVREALKTNTMNGCPKTETVLKATEHVLCNNEFSFENNYYKQIHGTAMGTPMAPTVANLFMKKLEEHILTSSPVPLNPDFWKRFIDDIFLIWIGSDEDLQISLDFINTVHPTIKFTNSVSSNIVSFLDIAISLKNGYFCTDLYSKPTDSHAYLRLNSCQPSHVKKNLPFSHLLRMTRLCSSEEIFF